jgi:poly(beta-D-mannuronate) lyase
MKKIISSILFLTVISLHVNASTLKVKNEIELQSANSKAVPGDIIELQNGEWNNIKLQFTCNGSAEKPIIIKAASRGSVIIIGKSSLQIGGNWLIIDGLVFSNGYNPSGNAWEFRVGKQVANNCRITNCVIKSFNNPDRMKDNYWVALYGKNNRIDHNNFIDKTNLGVLMAIILEDDRSRMNNHSIDSNYFGIRKPLGSNAGEIIRVGVSEHCTFYSNTKIVNNLFDRCDGETEIISIKSCGNLVRNNVFKECQGAVVLRHGNNNTIESNLFLGNGKEGTGGVRVINEGNWIVNNYFSHCVGEGFRSPLAVMNGVFNSPPNRYLPVRDAVIANNTFSNCTPFSVCEGSDTERSVVPKNVFIQNNLFYSDKEQVAFQYYDKIDSIYFRGNIINKKISKTINNGFDQKEPTVAMAFDNPFPSFNASKSKIILPDSIIQQASQRLQSGLSDRIGCSNAAYFIALDKQSKLLGIQWKMIEGVQTLEAKLPISCKDANEVYAALTTKGKMVEIILTGNAYTFDRPLSITNTAYFSTKNQLIRFAGSNQLNSLFKINPNAQLHLNNLNIDAMQLMANQFIEADSSGTAMHFSININNCQFNNFKGKSFLTTFRSAYADLISVNNTKFDQCTNIFTLTDETEKKGYYNVEKMVVNGCTFTNNSGQILGLCRTGNDESTMGPKLFFTKNNIQNCNNNKALIYLFGVQQSTLTDNHFSNSNTNKVVIEYSDNVRAKHEQKNNSFTNAGSITENKFVINLK